MNETRDQVQRQVQGRNHMRQATFRRLVLAIGVLATAGNAACGSSSSGGGSGGNTGAGTGGMTGAGSGGKSGTGGSGGPYLEAGVCGKRGMGKASATMYDVPTTFYIIGDNGNGSDVCAVKFDVKRVTATPPAGCTECMWSHMVEYSNPTVVTNTSGACAASESVPALDMASIMAYAGTRVGLGFSSQAGHGDAMLTYDTVMQKWIGVGRCNWDEPSGDFGYDLRSGNCGYGK